MFAGNSPMVSQRTDYNYFPISVSHTIGYIKAFTPKWFLVFSVIMIKAFGICAEGFWLRLISSMRLDGMKDV